VTQKIKATIDQKAEFGHNEMRHVNGLRVFNSVLLFAQLN